MNCPLKLGQFDKERFYLFLGTIFYLQKSKFAETISGNNFEENKKIN